jgi:hypothetical protein
MALDGLLTGVVAGQGELYMGFREQWNVKPG